MPKSAATSSSPDIKPDPYPKASPTKKPASPSKVAVFNDEMDRKIIIHVLKNSDINLRYNWKALIETEFPHMNTKQLKNRWDHKLGDAIFPPGVLQMSKQAKEGSAGKSEE